MEAIKCLLKSVEINPLQDGVWFTLGCAASCVSDFTLSIKSFKQCVMLEPDVTYI
jgi:hypothetical protein